MVNRSIKKLLFLPILTKKCYNYEKCVLRYPSLKIQFSSKPCYDYATMKNFSVLECCNTLLSGLISNN